MTVAKLQNQITALLEAGGCETPAFDAVCLLEDIGGVGRGQVAQARDRVLPKERVDAVLDAAERRASGEPLQYLLGTWDFLNLTLSVGPGVLIPRPETELLCQVAAECLRTIPHKNVYDLCAGSGCVGLGVTSLCPTAAVTAVEYSDEAFAYLKKNLKRYPSLAVNAVKADVLQEASRFSDGIDAIVSNPPYIPTADLAGLQREVQFEPRMALDGADGFRFYRAIAQEWVPKLAPHGIVAVEVGIGQGAEVACLFEQAGLTDTKVYADFAGIDRVVTARRALS